MERLGLHLEAGDVVLHHVADAHQADELAVDHHGDVADAALGTINAVKLSLAALGAHPTVVFLNRYDGADDLQRRNLDWLRTREGLEVVVDLEALTSVVRGDPASAGIG